MALKREEWGGGGGCDSPPQRRRRRSLLRLLRLIRLLPVHGRVLPLLLPRLSLRMPHELLRLRQIRERLSLH